MAFVEVGRSAMSSSRSSTCSPVGHTTAAEAACLRRGQVDELRKNLTQHITEQTPRIAADREVDTQPTLGFQPTIQRPILHVQSSGKKGVTGANVLVAIFGEKDSQRCLPAAAGHRAPRRRQLHLARHHQDAAGAPGQERGPGRRAGKPEPNLEQPARQLRPAPERARARRQDRSAEGHHKELERVVQTLCRRRKNNPLLVGEAGVGKTAIAEGLARRASSRAAFPTCSPSPPSTSSTWAPCCGTKYRRAAPEGGAEAAGR